MNKRKKMMTSIIGRFILSFILLLKCFIYLPVNEMLCSDLYFIQFIQSESFI